MHFPRRQLTFGEHCMLDLENCINLKMDMQKIVTLDGFGVRAEPREYLVKNAALKGIMHISSNPLARKPVLPRISATFGRFGL